MEPPGPAPQRRGKGRMAGPAATNTDKKILSGKKGVFYCPLFVAAGGMKYQKTAGSRPKNWHRQMTSTRRKTNHCLPILQALQAGREIFEMADDALQKLSLQRRAGMPRRGRWKAPPSGRAMRGGAAPMETTIGGPTRTRPRAGIPELGRGARPATRGRSSLGTTRHLLDGCRTREERDVRVTKT